MIFIFRMTKTIIISLILSAQISFAKDKDFSLDFLGKYSISSAEKFDAVLISGLSGIDYNRETKEYIAISDSRNTINEGVGRFYRLDIDTSINGINNVKIIAMNNLLDANGKPWKNGLIDAEGIAIIPNGDGFYWVSELGSALRIADDQGKFIADLSDVIPEYFSVKTQGLENSLIGIRKNSGFEGLSFTPKGDFLFIAAESALKQDFDIATAINSSPIRILKYKINPEDNALTMDGEFIYNLDPIHQVSKFGLSDNGLSEILAINDEKLLIIERNGRSLSQDNKVWDFNIRVYLVDLKNSTDIQGINSLKNTNVTNIQTANKKLLIDFSDITDKADNIEGLTFGPMINGKKSLVFVSDNNFQISQSNMFYLFLDNNDLLN